MSNEECNKSISCFPGSIEQVWNNDQNKNESIDDAIEFSTKKSGRKSLFGSPSGDTLFTLSTTLNTFVDQITNLSSANKFDYFLSGKKNNDPIENSLTLIGI